MIGCLWTHVPKLPIIALYFEFETVYSSFITAGPDSHKIHVSIGNKVESLKWCFEISMHIMIKLSFRLV